MQWIILCKFAQGKFDWKKRYVAHGGWGGWAGEINSFITVPFFVYCCSKWIWRPLRWWMIRNTSHTKKHIQMNWHANPLDMSWRKTAKCEVIKYSLAFSIDKRKWGFGLWKRDSNKLMMKQWICSTVDNMAILFSSIAQKCQPSYTSLWLFRYFS